MSASTFLQQTLTKPKDTPLVCSLSVRGARRQYMTQHSMS